jgi:hypothetical protein
MAMENYGTKNNEDDDDILDGKKNKKADQGGDRSAVEAQEEAKADARKSLLELFAERDKSEGAEITLFAPQPKKESAGTKDEQPVVGELTTPTQQELTPDHSNDNVELTGSQDASDISPTIVTPTQPKAASRLEDLFKEQPIFNQFRPLENTPEPEPVRPVSGYNREDSEYFRGYVPGLSQESQTYQPPMAEGSDNGGGNVPPRTPTRSGDSTPEPDGVRLPNFRAAENSKTKPNFAAVQTNELSSKHEDEVYTAERRGLRHGVVAGFLTGYILKAYLDGKRRKREAGEFQKQAQKQDEKIKQIQGGDLHKQKRLTEQERYIQQLQNEQQKIKQRFEERLAAQQTQPETHSKPVVFKPEKQRLTSPESAFIQPADLDKQNEKHDDKKVDMVEAARKALDEAIDKEDNKQRIEQDAWLRHVLDERGHEVQGIARGQEYKHERAQELLQRDHSQPQQPQAAHKAAAQPVFTGTSYHDASVTQTPSQAKLPSGQVPVDHQLPNGERPSPYFSSKKNSTLIAALTSPWTFLMLSVILLAYFIATLI